MSHHYRFIAPLLPADDEGLSPLHYYDSAIQLARQAEREPTEREFEVGIAAADEIKKMYVPDLSVDSPECLHIQACSRPERRWFRARRLTSASFRSDYDRTTRKLFLWLLFMRNATQKASNLWS